MTTTTEMRMITTTDYLLAHPLALYCLSLDPEKDYSVSELYPYVNAFIEKAAETLCEYVRSIGCEKFVLGLSGGLDSSFVALVANRALQLLGKPSANLILVMLPGFGTGKTTSSNAERLIKHFGSSHKVIDIKELCTLAMKAIGIDENDRTTAFENIQARIRTTLLLTLANKENAIELGTGDYSEGAVGWCTYGGDNISSYNINMFIPKSLLRLVMFVKGVQDNMGFLKDIATVPITPELLPSSDEFGQKTEDVIGEYDLIDYLLYEKVVLNNNREKSIENAINYNRIITSKSGDKRREYILRYSDVFYKRLDTQWYKRLSCPHPVLTPLTSW